MRRISSIVFLSLIVALASCTSSKKAGKKGSDLDQLLSYMTGSFSSKEQAMTDSSYYHITLHMYPIWKGTHKGNWIYVEQAVASAPDKPYRQRVYKVEQTGKKSFISYIYALPNPKAMVGAHNDESSSSDLSPDDLILREGCAVFLEKTGKNTFAGSTKEGACGSTLRGATYATSKVTITEGVLESWDQGWDEDGVQVWGAEKGAYIFKR